MKYPANSDQHPQVKSYLDKDSNTFSYLVSDPKSSVCAVIDPVLDFNYAGGLTSTNGVDQIAADIKSQNLTLDWIIESHVHADHLSGAKRLKALAGGRTAIGSDVQQVQQTFSDFFNPEDQLLRDGSQFDHLFADGERYQVGQIEAFTISTPGHTPACMVHVIGDCVFVGDTLFMPDSGTARADFPGGDSGQLYDSIQKILALPRQMRLFVCHDYGPNGRDLQFETTVGEQRDNNIHVGAGKSRDDYIAMRDARDATLSVPRLILPSLQVNMRAGEFPRDSRGRLSLNVPIDQFDSL